jgi:hypothetical protein
MNMVSSQDLNRNSIFIAVREKEIIPGTTYFLQDRVQFKNEYLSKLSFAYWDENSKEYAAYVLKENNPNAPDDGTFKITRFADNGGYGEFSAVLVEITEEGSISPKKSIVITNGEFFLPLYKNSSN